MRDQSFEAMMETARLAEREKSFDRALTGWETLRTLYPDRPQAFVGFGRVLQALRRDDEAEVFLGDAVRRFPDDGDLAELHGWAAHHRSDWKAADLRWSDLRHRFPARVSGYSGGGATLSMLNRPDEADAVYRAAFARFPITTPLLEGFARVAVRKADWAEAGRRWTTVRTLFPNNVQAHIQQANCLREAGRSAEAEAALTEAATRFSDQPQFAIALAEMSARDENWVETLKRWDDVATRFPGLADGYLGAARTLVILGRHADAQNAILPAVRMFPESLDVAIANARIAHRRQDWPEAVRRWRDIQTRFPHHVPAHAAVIAALREAAMLDEAEREAAAARTRFPLDWEILAEWARIANGDKPQAACERWATVRDLHPERITAYANLAAALSRAGRSEEARTVLGEALARLGRSSDLSQAFAQEAMTRRDWPEAERHWREAIDQSPTASAHAGLARAFRDGGKLPEAEAFLRGALERFPGHLDLESDYALVISRKRDWPAALALWSKLKSKFPRHPGIQARIGQELIQARLDLAALSQEAEGGAAFEIPAILEENVSADVAGDALKPLFMGFESIGDSCEFGIVQRRFGAEPMSLLRWASTSPENLAKALDARLEGVGDPEHTVVAVTHGEYTTRDKRYYMLSHTFTPESAAPQSQFFTQQCKRMQYLRRKLLEDLETSEKIFVYKSNSGISDSQIRRLHKSIKNYGGPARLLVARLADDDHPVGALERWEENLFVGYTDRFSTIDINVDNWVSLCKRVREALSPTTTAE